MSKLILSYIVPLKEENEDDIYDLPVCAIGVQFEKGEHDFYEEKVVVSAQKDQDPSKVK